MGTVGCLFCLRPCTFLLHDGSGAMICGALGTACLVYPSCPVMRLVVRR